MAALPILEKLRVLCSDIERRRLAVANVLLTAEEKQRLQQSLHHKKDHASSNLHENIDFIRDQFTLRQAEAVREASISVLDSLDSEEMNNLVQLFVNSRMAIIKANNNSNSISQNPQVIAQRAIESFELSAAHLRDYHRQYPQKPFQLPQLERPNEQDIRRIRNTLFTGPERKGKSVDLTSAYKLFRDFQTQSSLAAASASTSGAGAASASSSSASTNVVTIVDQEVTYVDFLQDPVVAASSVSVKRKIDSGAKLYIPCLQAAIISLERFVAKTRPLTAAAEIKEARDRVSSLMASIIKSMNNNNNSKNFIAESGLSDKVKEAWKKFVMDKHIAAMSSSSSSHREQEQKNALLKILQLEEHLALLCSSVVGEAILAASADHLTRSSLRSTAEEAQDADDDELKFQQDFFDAYYAQVPLSDRIGVTMSENGRTVAASMSDLEKVQDRILAQDGAGSGAGRKGGGDEGGDDGDADGSGKIDGEDNHDLSPEERARLVNPKNFPLDALGNPIPVWLFKLHQLDKKLYCEICGHAYPGEKIYTQHFSELRHETGLARIGIIITPFNAPHFRLIPTREGALQAQRRLLEGEENAKRRLRGDDEEVEDAAGHVITLAQTYRY